MIDRRVAGDRISVTGSNGQAIVNRIVGDTPQGITGKGHAFLHSGGGYGPGGQDAIASSGVDILSDAQYGKNTVVVVRYVAIAVRVSG